MRLVVNVDDLGWHLAVRRAVEAAAEAGVVTSASVVANGPDVREALSVGGIGLGVHLNAVRGEPISPADEVSSLTDGCGRFTGSAPRLFARYIRGRLRPEQVEREWSRQIESLMEAGLEPTHLDSEKHVHLWPLLWPVAIRVAKRFGIRWVRSAVERTPALRLDAGGLRAKLLAGMGRNRKPDTEIRSPDATWGIADEGGSASPERFRAFLHSVSGARVVEVVCHPGDPRPDDPPIPASVGRTRIGRLWKAEFDTLMSPEWRGMLQEEGVELTHFGILGALERRADAEGA